MSRYSTFHYDEMNKNGELIKVTKCLSHYAGKVVVGVSKCHPNDVYDAAKGDAIARARCDIRVAEKRKKNAENKLAEAKDMLDYCVKYYEDMKEYVNTSTESLQKAKEVLKDLPTDR